MSKGFVGALAQPWLRLPNTPQEHPSKGWIPWGQAFPSDEQHSKLPCWAGHSLEQNQRGHGWKATLTRTASSRLRLAGAPSPESRHWVLCLSSGTIRQHWANAWSLL